MTPARIAAIAVVAATVLGRAAIAVADDPPSNIIYMNRCIGGCTILGGPLDNAQSNTSSVAQGAGPFYLTEFQYDDTVWNAVVECVRETYGPYNVVITDVDPGGIPHHESIVAGSADQIGLDPTQVGGVSSGTQCQPANNRMSFTFAAQWPDDVLTLCMIVAQESGHTWGLDHVFDCSDPMTYLPRCGQQYFRNKPFPCGEFETRSCPCTGETQNAHIRLRSIFGVGQPIPIPVMDLTAPTPDATVASGFVARATATAHRGFGHAELWLNGYNWGEAPGDVGITTQAFQLAAPTEVPDGVIDVEVRIYDDLDERYASETVTVTKGAPCTSADSCLVGQRCEAGRCFWDPPAGDFGAACDYDQYCLSGQCREGACTVSCATGIAGQCPEGFECGQGYCVEVEPQDTCCSIGKPTPAAIAGQLILIGFVVAGLRRRSRSR